MQTNQSRTHAPHRLLYGALMFWDTCPNRPRTRCHTTETALMPRNLLKLFTVASAKPAHPAVPFLPTETTRKTLLVYVSPSPSASGPTRLLLPYMAVCGVVCPLPLGVANDLYSPIFIEIKLTNKNGVYLRCTIDVLTYVYFGKCAPHKGAGEQTFHRVTNFFVCGDLPSQQISSIQHALAECSPVAINLTYTSPSQWQPHSDLLAVLHLNDNKACISLP